MSTIVDDATERVADAIRRARAARGWSLADLAGHSGVSKAMISKIERGEASPTVALLGRLAEAFDIALPALLAGARRGRGSGRGGIAKADPAGGAGRLRRDKRASGYVQWQFAPPSSPLELTLLELPPRSRVAQSAASRFVRQLVFVFGGELTFVEGDETHVLEDGDCLELDRPSNCVFRNRGRKPCVYLVAQVMDR